MTRLNRAMIFVKDLDRMANFYALGFGLKPVEGTRTESWAEFEAGGSRLALHAIPSHIEAAIDIQDPPRAREENAIKLIFEVDDLSSAKARLQSQGATFIERPWGAWDGLDPEGNVFQIGQGRPIS